MVEFIPLLMFGVICLVLLAGFPVAFSLAGTALIFAGVGILTGTFESAFLGAIPNRLYGDMTNMTLVAVPLFVFMGVLLEKSNLAQDLLSNMSEVIGGFRGSLAIAVIFVGALIAASTGIVGATVIAMGLISLPIMLSRQYDPSLSAGTICATGTLGQIIPPSIALVILGDVLSAAYQQSQLSIGNFSARTVSVGDLFMGALIPGIILVLCYALYVIVRAYLSPQMAPSQDAEIIEGRWKIMLTSLLPPFVLITSVLGSILLGIATPTEAAGVGALGAIFLALSKSSLNRKNISEAVETTTEITAMVFMILLGSSIFSLVFRGFGGDDLITGIFTELPGGAFGAVLVVMIIIFLLGFILDFIQITLVVVPIVGPALLMLGVDPIWLGIMIAINLQTSFLTPPFGFALFYLRGVAPDNLATRDIYRGVIPFICIQIGLLIALAIFPQLVTALPQAVYGN
ncbi:MAG: TRAP transporter large permease subunit [Pseudomonadota bacterium]|nr:TRAP transporter large permease subunit [Pseudomonadota bacterium]MEC8448357.1 TRAP transporter large permease subunit [Pseudomonadota bacterium]MEC8797934.1 TRAP transporter large permease subunit [Pseudomonadota bacterium]MED5349146.1 TRAP transporter large permease subunit [Pseudomonadota bacterium]GIR87706.1 MAG: C4-dicarboxylate ABC transporter [Gammaproteobacteria bacterium]